MTLKFIRRYRCPIIKKLKTLVKRNTDHNSDCETLTPGMRELKQRHWFQIAGVNVVSKEDKENAVNGKQQDSVREETSVVSGTMKISVQNRHLEPGSSLDSRAKST